MGEKYLGEGGGSIKMSEPLDFDTVLKNYLKWRELHNFSQSTLITNKRSLKHFRVFLEKKNKLDLKNVKAGDLREYMGELESALWAPSTKAGYIMTMRSLFQFLAKDHRLFINPLEKLEKFKKKPGRLPQVLSEKEIQQLLSSPFQNYRFGTRDRALLELFYSSGLRKMELSRLKLEDLDFEGGTIHVIKGKGQKDRTVPVGQDALFWIKKYLEKDRLYLTRLNPETRDLFLSERSFPLSSSRIGTIVKNHAKAVGIKKRVYPHLLRHTMATHLLTHGANLRIIQGILGHAELTTTKNYTHLDKKDLKKVHKRCHPRMQWEIKHRKKGEKELA